MKETKDLGKVLYYKMNGSRPDGRGYYTYSRRYITGTLADEALLELFRQRRHLPKAFGSGLGERCVEYPWALARVRNEDTRILDAGSALNFHYLVKTPQLSNKVLTCVTLAPEAECLYREGVGYLFEDLRWLPLRDDSYDLVISISTVEHLGMDNSVYTSDLKYQESNPDSFTAAIGEFRRILKPGGRLLVTVPYGEFQCLGWLQNFDKALLNRLTSAFRGAVLEKTYYRYAQGWQICTAAHCSAVKYNDKWAPRFNAAGAIACVEMQKPLDVAPDTV